VSLPKAVTPAKRVKRLDEHQSHEPVDEKLKKAELEELEREKVHIQIQRMCNNDTFTVSSAKAALFLGVKPDELVDRRNGKEPPPPWPLWEKGKSGTPVKYFAKTLFQYVTGEAITQRDPYLNPLNQLPSGKVALTVMDEAVTASALAAQARKKSGWTRPISKWVSSPLEEWETSMEPFFVDDNNLILLHAWEDLSKTCDLFMTDSIDVVWLKWDDALAHVWFDEGCRLRWLGTASAIESGLRDVVEAKRREMFAKV